ncbi:MAG: hypothetical protein J6B87_05975 [Clostridia bacterium]|nr:hypothetical protein [Clostridia bacterium]
MKNKIIGIIFILMVLSSIKTTTYALRCLCSSPVKYYYNATSTTHDVECTACSGYVTTESHSFGSYTNNGLGKTHTTTCSKCDYESTSSHSYQGYAYYNSTTHRNKCSKCSSYYSGNHSYSGTVTTAATCTSTGVMTYKCGTCGHSYTSEIAKTGHSYGNWVTTVSATCVSTGTEVRTCTACSATDSRTIPLSGHSYSSNYTEDVAATCTAAGSKSQHCTRTGCTSKQNITAIPALGHTGGTATCTNAKVCTRCGSSYGNALNHDFSGAWTKYNDDQHRRKCSRCSEYEYGNHSEGTAATCTEAKKCSVCSSYYGNSLGHNYTGAWTKYDEIQHRRKCSRCSEYEYGNHSGGTATCTAAKVCSTCSTAYGNPLGHNFTIACPKCNTANIVCSRNNSHTDTHDCSIYVTPPTVTSIHRWTGSTIRAVATHSSGYYTLSGDPTATNVGRYTATATLKGGTEPTYRWSDTKTTEARTYTWSIFDISVKSKATITGPTGVQVKTGEIATFKVVATSGTNIKYQWYYNTSNSTSGGTKIPGAKDTSYSVTVDKNMNNRYYYCVLSNNSDSVTSVTETASNTALLTVWWPHEISAHPVDTKVKKGETASFSVTATGGNPSTYTYQWYSVPSATGGTPTKINGATQNTYSYAPTQNISGMWYYCVVSNGQYTLTSNRAKLVADITVPTVNAGTPSVTHANKNVRFTIPITVSDTGEGFNTNSFIASDVVVKVNGTKITPTVKTLDYKSQNGNNYNYVLTLEGVTSDGLLTLEVAAGAISDNHGNLNANTSMLINGITIDNIAPVISSNGPVTGTNEGYINSKDKITVPVKVTDVGGINFSEFAPGDVAVLVGGAKNSDAQVTVTYTGKTGNDYTYIITITNITGNGEMTLEIADGKIYDFATNPNIKTTLSGLNVKIDNIKPIVNDIVLSLGSYNNSSKLYPESLPTYNESWINEDVYVVIKSSDESSGVETYWHSVGTKSNFNLMPTDREVLSNEMDERDKIYYKVIDRAGNESDITEIIVKIDKTSPIVADLDMRLNRENGTIYEYEVDNPTSKSIYVKPKGTVDSGTYQSGILKTEYIITFNNGVTTTTSDIINAENETILKETGTYKIEVITTDKSGNTSNQFFDAAIEKSTENTITISNIYDDASGVKKATIEVRKQGASEDVFDPIIIENPGSTIKQRIKLSDGTFVITVKLEDAVGLVKELKQTITNEL